MIPCNDSCIYQDSGVCYLSRTTNAATRNLAKSVCVYAMIPQGTMAARHREMNPKSLAVQAAVSKSADNANSVRADLERYLGCYEQS